MRRVCLLDLVLGPLGDDLKQAEHEQDETEVDRRYCVYDVGAYKENLKSGSGCGSFGRVVASDTRSSQFKTSHRQTLRFIEHLFTVLKRRK